MLQPPHNDSDNESLFPEPERETKSDPQPTSDRAGFRDRDDAHPVLIRVDRSRSTGQYRRPRRGGPRSREFRY